MGITERHTIAVIMQRTIVRRGPWSVPSWQAVSVVAGAHLAGKAAGCTPLFEGQGEDKQQFLWTGFSLDFYRDLAEAYWYNLTSDNPSLFVICHEAPDGEVTPYQVTADPDSATACLESDGQAFALPIPPEIYQSLERFVVTHYQPREKKKRKRENWSESPDQ